MGSHTEKQLRSLNGRRGRPSNTFGDPVSRLCAWWWLGEVLRTFGAEKVGDLRRLAPSRGFKCDATLIRALQEIAKDGTDPERMRVGAKKLVNCLGAICPKPVEVSKHPLWEYMRSRELPAEIDQWVDRAMAVHGLVQIEMADVIHGQALGLLAQQSPESGEVDPRPEDFGSPVEWDASRFKSLDGLLLLALMLRDAQDSGYDELMVTLRKVLPESALLLGDTHLAWHPESKDTLIFLVMTRLARWTPTHEPRPEEIELAFSRLTAAFESDPKRHGRTLSPNSVTQGRSERRWRRRAWVQAAIGDLSTVWWGQDCTFVETRADLAWLASNREILEYYFHVALIESFLGDENDPEDPIALSKLQPLKMPQQLYDERVRPPISAIRGERRLFGLKTHYDVIPIEPE